MRARSPHARAAVDVEDICVASDGTVEWNEAPAWRAEFALDAAAHPGLRELRQIYVVAPVVGPVGDGHLVLAFRGEPEACKRLDEVLTEIARGVEFR